MFKMVLIDISKLLDRQTDEGRLAQVKSVTTDGFKEYWSVNTPFWVSALVTFSNSMYNRVGLVRWTGPEEQYLLARLTENTGLILTQLDIEEDNKILLEIEDLLIRIRHVLGSIPPEKDDPNFKYDSGPHTSLRFDIERKLVQLLSPVSLKFK